MAQAAFPVVGPTTRPPGFLTPHCVALSSHRSHHSSMDCQDIGPAVVLMSYIEPGDIIELHQLIKERRPFPVSTLQHGHFFSGTSGAFARYVCTSYALLYGTQTFFLQFYLTYEWLAYLVLEHILEPETRPHTLNDPHMAFPQWTWRQDALPEYLWDVVLFSDDVSPSANTVRISYRFGCCHVGVHGHQLIDDREPEMANTQETQAITGTQTLTDQHQHGPSPSSKMDIRQREGQHKRLRVTPLQTPADRKQQQRCADHVEKQGELQRQQWQESQATTVTQTLTDANRARQKQETKDEASHATTPIETPGGCKHKCAQPMVALMFIGSPHHCSFSPLALDGDWDWKALCAVAAPASYLSHGQPMPFFQVTTSNVIRVCLKCETLSFLTRCHLNLHIPPSPDNLDNCHN